MNNNLTYQSQALTETMEGIKLKAYLASAGVPTIGFGHTKGVKMGDVCTLAQAQQWLKEDLKSAVNDVNRLVQVKLTQNQFDACVDFVFNLGGTNFAKSTLLKHINDNNFVMAANEFPKWNKARVNGQLVSLAGLTKRRLAEKELFERK